MELNILYLIMVLAYAALNTVLNMGIRKYGFDRIRKAGKSVHAGNKDVINFAVFDIGKNAHAAEPSTARKLS